MQIKEADLPGIGRKYTVQTAADDLIVIIIHYSGRREIYLMEDPDADEPVYTVNLNDEESRRLGSILMGADFQPVSDKQVDFIAKSFFVGWITVSPQSPLAHKSLKEGQVKNVTGANVIAIRRGDQIIANPGADELLLPHDQIMVIGKRDQIRSLEPLCGQDGCGVDHHD
ncbi:MAG: TrkA C-terminal domain-containing protein [Bacillota bacterium]